MTALKNNNERSKEVKQILLNVAVLKKTTIRLQEHICSVTVLITALEERIKKLFE